MHRPQAGSSPRRFTSPQRAGKTRKVLLLATMWLAGGAGLLASCSNDNSRGPNSEMRVDPPDASAGTKIPARGEAPRADTEEPVGTLTGAGRKYRVAVETAYFFDKPEQSTPNGRYLRRGDAFFGEGETNGFVKTGFVQPNGSAGTAWLKVQELSRLTEGPGKQSGRRSSTSPVAQSVANDGYGSEPPQPGPRQRPAVTSPSGAMTAVVQVARSYFYNSPDLAVPRKAYCERGDKVRLGESRGEAVYVTFTNWEKVTTTGWMKKAALGIVNP
ncbi:MAG: hypothetical protein JWP58_881 [Hymenobacter sp.]|nr:hypothetical protein [Hymenobacter sp.]